MTDGLFDWNHTLSADYLKAFCMPWQALDGLGDWIRSLGKTLSRREYEEIGECVWVHRTAKIAPTAVLGTCVIVGAETEVRQGAYIRGSALVGKNCVIGNSTELKNSIVFDNVQLPHYNYVGDSILGYGVHLGAGAVLSNVKSDKSSVKVAIDGAVFDTGRKKCGAFLGDGAEIGCNSVLNPGTVVGRNATVYPLSCVRGYLPPDSIYKTGGVIVLKK